jgi:hypothetical protein
MVLHPPYPIDAEDCTSFWQDVSMRRVKLTTFHL